MGRLLAQRWKRGEGEGKGGIHTRGAIGTHVAMWREGGAGGGAERTYVMCGEG